jgi:hypothetical protein
MKTQKSMSTRQRLKQLYKLKDKIRYEKLGQEDSEYRDELDRLEQKVNAEIQSCKERIEKNLP